MIATPNALGGYSQSLVFPLSSFSPPSTPNSSLSSPPYILPFPIFSIQSNLHHSLSLSLYFGCCAVLLYTASFCHSIALEDEEEEEVQWLRLSLWPNSCTLLSTPPDLLKNPSSPIPLDPPPPFSEAHLPTSFHSSTTSLHLLTPTADPPVSSPSPMLSRKRSSNPPLPPIWYLSFLPFILGIFS